VASLVAAILVVALAGLLSSPDVPPVTIATWAKVAPADFVATAASELAGTSETAQYGPPYNNQSGSLQSLLFSPAKIPGVRQPIDAAQTFVLAPLDKEAPTDPALARALDQYSAASGNTQSVGHRLRQGGHQSPLRRGRERHSAARRRRACAGPARHRAEPGP
jgi:hypothetical protein